MAGHLVVTLWGETARSLLWFPGPEVIGSVELYLVDSLEIAGKSVGDTVGRNSAQSQLRPPGTEVIKPVEL